jgi:hypothetical protein
MNKGQMSKCCNLGTIASPLMSLTSNNLIITCLASHLLNKKLTTTTNMSSAPFDIDKSNVQVVMHGSNYT